MTPDEATRREQGASRAASPESDCLAGGGEMGARMRALGWAATPLGPVETWPQSLRTSVSICVGTSFPMLICWGPELVMLYNDAYRPVLGSEKHPAALGQPLLHVWREIREIVEPMLRAVLATGEAVGAEDMMFSLERSGYTEETYFTFSCSPIRDESGGIGGVLVTCTETTHRVVGARRLRMLHALAEGAVRAGTAEEALAAAAVAFDPAELPFALLYLLDRGGTSARLAATSGLRGPPAAPLVRVDVTAPAPAWPLAEVLAGGTGMLVGDLDGRGGPWPGGPWPEPTRHAMVLPIARAGQTDGFLVAGISPRRALDDAYREYLELVVGHLATSLTRARTDEDERRRRTSDDQRAAMYQLLAQAPTPIYILRGRDRVVELANPQACSVWGVRPEHAIGRPAGDVVPELSSQVFRELLDRVLTTGEPCLSKEVPARFAGRGDVHVRFFNIAYAPLRDTAGAVDGVMAIAFDVTDEVVAREQLARAVRHNELFAGILGHDLRNPLSAIITGAELVLQRSDDERICGLASRIVSSGERMSRMIDQLLDYTRIRVAGGLQLEPHPVDVAEIAARVIGEIELAHPRRRIHLDVVGDPAGEWDGDRLSQVFSNLAGNAVQHGAPDSPLRVRIDGRDPTSVAIRFENQGVVPPELLPGLFDPFRSSRRTRERSRGLGLGLFISREVIRAHGGDVSVSSTPAEGTVFTVTLPRRG